MEREKKQSKNHSKYCYASICHLERIRTLKNGNEIKIIEKSLFSQWMEKLIDRAALKLKYIECKLDEI